MPSQIPDTIQDDEKLVRIIFSPYHVRFNKKTKEIKGIKNSAFHSIPEMDEVSVTRIKFSSLDFCKTQAKEMENNANQNGGNKEYQGFAIVKYLDVINANAFVKVTPTINNSAHADIYYKFVKKRGEAYPAEINLIIEEIVNKTSFLKDPSPDEERWLGENIDDLT